MALFGKLFGRRGDAHKDAKREPGHQPVDATMQFDARGAAGGSEQMAEAASQEELDPGEPVIIALPDGEQLEARAFYAADAMLDAPGILWLHGDDPTSGPSSRYAMARLMCQHRPCAVLVVDHPAGVVSCHAALQWLRDGARRHGIATDQLFVGGTGPAADLAVETALFERDQGGIALAYLMALYPSLGSGWDAGFSNVTRDKGLAGLPAATVISGMGDPSCPDVTRFVERMRAAGVDVDFHMYRTALRGTGLVGSNPDVAQARTYVLRQLDEAVVQRRAPQPRVRRVDVPLV